MKKWIVPVALSVALIGFSGAAHANGRQPCDRGAGGVSHCKNGKFVCNNGTVSKSKLRCTGSGKRN